MFLLIILVLIAIFVMISAYNDTKRAEREKERQAAHDEYRRMIYSWFNECEWCGREYQIKNGDEDFCSQKCIHEHKKANK